MTEKPERILLVRLSNREHEDPWREIPVSLRFAYEHDHYELREVVPANEHPQVGGEAGLVKAAGEARDLLVKACNEDREAQAKAIEGGIYILSEALAAAPLKQSHPALSQEQRERLGELADRMEAKAVRRAAYVMDGLTIEARAKVVAEIESDARLLRSLATEGGDQ